MIQKMNKYLFLTLLILSLFTQCTYTNNRKDLYFSNYKIYKEYTKKVTIWFPPFIPINASEIYYFYYYDENKVFWFYGKYKYVKQEINLNKDHFNTINENKIIDEFALRQKKIKPKWFISFNNISNKKYFHYKDIYFIIDKIQQVVYFY